MHRRVIRAKDQNAVDEIAGFDTDAEPAQHAEHFDGLSPPFRQIFSEYVAIGTRLGDRPAPQELRHLLAGHQSVFSGAMSENRVGDENQQLANRQMKSVEFRKFEQITDALSHQGTIQPRFVFPNRARLLLFCTLLESATVA